MDRADRCRASRIHPEISSLARTRQARSYAHVGHSSVRVHFIDPIPAVLRARLADRVMNNFACRRDGRRPPHPAINDSASRNERLNAIWPKRAQPSPPLPPAARFLSQDCTASPTACTRSCIITTTPEAIQPDAPSASPIRYTGQSRQFRAGCSRITPWCHRPPARIVTSTHIDKRTNMSANVISRRRPDQRTPACHSSTPQCRHAPSNNIIRLDDRAGLHLIRRLRAASA